ncbi:MAG: hypothetical protein PUJ43_05530 [Bacillales bacterium]|nr:hypothetical protein [Bacillales bacterium]MDY5919902.1 hypothetical protein [Candidatus Enteromonas sp.]
MEKITSFLQKWLWLIALILFALLAVFAISMATPTAVCSSYGGPEPGVTTFYQAYQSANDALLILGACSIVITFLFKGLRSSIRPIYYLGNFVSCAAVGIMGIASGVTTLVATSRYQAGYATLPIDAMNQYWLDHGSNVTIEKSPAIFPLGYVLSVCLVLAGVAAFVLFALKLIARIRYEKSRKGEAE